MAFSSNIGTQKKTTSKNAAKGHPVKAPKVNKLITADNPAGIKFHANEQSAATFDIYNSKYLPPVGVDANGVPIYDAPGTADEYNRANTFKPELLAQRRKIKNEAAGTVPGSYSPWTYAAIIIAALLMGYIATRKKS